MSTKTLAPWGMRGGVTNFTRNEAAQFARDIVQDPLYRENLKERARKGDLNAGTEAMLWYYAYGKPQETVQVNVSQTVSELSTLSLEELEEKAREALRDIREAREVESAIDVVATSVH